MNYAQPAAWECYGLTHVMVYALRRAAAARGRDGAVRTLGRWRVYVCAARPRGGVKRGTSLSRVIDVTKTVFYPPISATCGCSGDYIPSYCPKEIMGNRSRLAVSVIVNALDVGPNSKRKLGPGVQNMCMAKKGRAVVLGEIGKGAKYVRVPRERSGEREKKKKNTNWGDKKIRETDKDRLTKQRVRNKTKYYASVRTEVSKGRYVRTTPPTGRAWGCAALVAIAGHVVAKEGYNTPPVRRPREAAEWIDHQDKWNQDENALWQHHVALVGSLAVGADIPEHLGLPLTFVSAGNVDAGSRVQRRHVRVLLARAVRADAPSQVATAYRRQASIPLARARPSRFMNA
ncbi:hypothetical protein EDB86DRAFT_2830767 [Lactarius hatsudake]|nr:hypothetical protein EDB86DRAFT_2830767 [Lactarius hatsudake]